MGTEKVMTSGIKRKREGKSEMGMIMADILQTELNNDDSVILAHSDETSCAVKKFKPIKGNVDKDGVDTISGKLAKKPEKLKKVKSGGKLRQIKAKDIETVDSSKKTSKVKPENAEIVDSGKKKKPKPQNSETVDLIGDPENGQSLTDARLGLADVMSKILNKKVNSANVILAKCETDKQRLVKAAKVQSSEKEQHTSSKEKDDSDNPEVKAVSSERQRLLKKKHWEMLGRVKLTVLDRDRERNLQRIATKGVVQLFNAVHKQQAMLDIKVKDAGATDSKRERAVQSLTKGNFLDMLKSSKNDKSAKLKLEPMINDDSTSTNLGEPTPTWSVLRDDFMGGATMKDWDRQGDSD